MSSFQISISQHRRAAGRFIGAVRRAIQRAFVEENKRTGLTQSEIARRLGVHRSVISRELNGRKDLTLGRVAELAWAMGRNANFSLEKAPTDDGRNYFVPAQRTPDIVEAKTNRTSSGNVTVEFSV
jgi:transcriptional regulator with XRE-family HTH domain